MVNQIMIKFVANFSNCIFSNIIMSVKKIARCPFGQIMSAVGYARISGSGADEGLIGGLNGRTPICAA